MLKVEPKQPGYQLLHPNFDPKALKAATPIATGLPASPGAAAGKCVLHCRNGRQCGPQLGIKAILVREETTPEDIERHGPV